MSPILSLVIAAVAGILPALLWLFFWLREDRLHPEPKKILFRCFFFGMLAVVVVVPLEQSLAPLFKNTALILFAWAFVEETLKYIAGYIGGIRSKADDEPLDPVIYMITAALGFAALENVFFLIAPFTDSNILLGLVTSNVRFVGATVLHTVSSAAVGLALAFAFYKNRVHRIVYQSIGLGVAIVIHTLFNHFILRESFTAIVGVFGFVWLALILLLLFFEKIKRIKAPQA